MARISTHVLDISRGVPASGVAIELYLDGKAVGSARTNADGRTDVPLLAGDSIPTGTYHLLIHAGEYLKRTGTQEPAFFDIIRLEFCVGNASGNYHVPLLLAAHGYSTYRGS
jgi:5-hydroxyisourate hydrolase